MSIGLYNHLYAVGDYFVCYGAVCFESNNFVCRIYYQYFESCVRPSIQKFVSAEAHDVIVGGWGCFPTSN